MVPGENQIGLPVNAGKDDFQNKILSRTKGDRESFSDQNLQLLITSYRALVRKQGPIAKLMDIIWPTTLARSRAGTSLLAKTLLMECCDFVIFFLGHKVFPIKKVKDETKPLTNLLRCELRLGDIKNKSCQSKVIYDHLSALSTLVL